MGIQHLRMDTKKVVLCVRILVNNESESLKCKALTQQILHRLYSSSWDFQVVLFVSFNDDSQMLDEMETLIRRCHIGKFPFLETKGFDIVAKVFFAVQDRNELQCILVGKFVVFWCSEGIIYEWLK